MLLLHNHFCRWLQPTEYVKMKLALAKRSLAKANKIIIHYPLALANCNRKKSWSLVLVFQLHHPQSPLHNTGLG
jgi:hypothetical protein